MKDYQNSKIYKIQSKRTEDIYIGSTCHNIFERFYRHLASYKRWKNGKTNNTTAFEILKYEDAYIDIIETYPCNSKVE